MRTTKKYNSCWARVSAIFLLMLSLPGSAAAALTGGFSSTGSMSTARYGYTATLLPNGKVLVAGGESGGSGSEPEASNFGLIIHHQDG